MQIGEALLREGTRLRGRITAEDGRARHVALLQTHRLTVFHIDRRKENHGFHFKKFAISARPSF